MQGGLMEKHKFTMPPTKRLFHRARAARVTPERLWGVRFIRWAFSVWPPAALQVMLPVWKCCRKISRNWDVDWYFVVLDILVRFSLCPLPIEQKRLLMMGKCPDGMGSHHLLKYRTPLWWAAATYGRPPILNQLKQQHLHINDEGQECNFVYMALASGNLHSLNWAVQQNIDFNTVGPLGKPLLCHALSRCTPDNPHMVQALLSGGANWYYAGPFGESAFSYTVDQPLWSVWWSKYSLQQELVKEPHIERSAKKLRKM